MPAPTTMVSKSGRVGSTLAVLIGREGSGGRSDDAARLRPYVRSFNPGFLAATGTAQAISRTAQTFGLGYARIVRPDGTYTIEHGSSLFVVDPSGALFATFPAPHDPRILASDYRLIVEHARARERAFSPAKLFAR